MSYCAFCGNQVAPGTAVCPYCGKPPSGIQPPVAAKSSVSGPVVIVLIVAVLVGALAVVGIIAALLVPNFLDALQKAKQKRTMADMRNLGTAVFTYATDKSDGVFPPAKDLQELSPYLVPEYVQSVPTKDGWERPFQYTCWQDSPGSEGCDHIRITSAGRDGIFESEGQEFQQPIAFAPTDYDRDIVWQDGYFLQSPGSPGQP